MPDVFSARPQTSPLLMLVWMQEFCARRGGCGALSTRDVQLQQVERGIITWVCTNRPAASDTCTCVQNLLNNCQPDTPRQNKPNIPEFTCHDCAAIVQHSLYSLGTNMHCYVAVRNMGDAEHATLEMQLATVLQFNFWFNYH